MADAVVVPAPGELDIATADRFRDDVAFYLAAGIKRLVIDMAGVRFVDSSGIGALMAIAKRTKALDVDLIIRNVGPNAWTALRMSGASRVLTIEGDQPSDSDSTPNASV